MWYDDAKDKKEAMEIIKLRTTEELKIGKRDQASSL